jgi:hypothetical protein
LFTLLSEGAVVTRSVEIPDAAVEKALDTYLEWNSQGAERDIAMAAALVAARPYLMPTREALIKVIRDEFNDYPEGLSFVTALDGGILPVSQVAALAADAVLALLSTSGESGK